MPGRTACTRCRERMMDENQAIVTETPNVPGMVRNRRLARAITDAGGQAAQADCLQGAMGATDPPRGGSVVPEHPAVQRVGAGLRSHSFIDTTLII